MQPRFRWTSPRKTALHILRAWLGEPASSAAASPLGLAQHQQDAARRLSLALQRRGGAILADSVGLGKTFVALALIRAALDARERVLVIAPAALRTHWRKHLEKLGSHDVAFTTHTALSRGRILPVEPSLIVIDEAHGFRNPATRRYRNLRRLVRNARVLLITATPINNSADDLYHLLRLFARDDAFRDLGVADLNRAFRFAGRGEVDRVVNEVVVRRGRSQVKADGELRFPERLPPVAVRYDAQWSSTLYNALEELAFAPYALDSAAPAELMRLHLLKRLESSVVAFRSSVRALLGITQLFLDGSPRTRVRMPNRADEWLQLALPIDSEHLNGAARRVELRAAAERDLELLRRCQHAVAAPQDSKLARLNDLLEREKDAKTIVFTQYADTAKYVWKQLRQRYRVGLVTGTDARLGGDRAARSSVIECFAPRANGRRTKLHERLQIDVLIATDVLSEGLNLQDASVVVNYEISWNPVTLMQRVGRVDRLGSCHAAIRVYNFVPERGLDQLLRLMERVEHKLATIDRLVGSDAPVLDVPAVGAARRAVGHSITCGTPEDTQLGTLMEAESLRQELMAEFAARAEAGPGAEMHGAAEVVAASVASAKCDVATFPGGPGLELIALRWRGAVRLLLCDAEGVRENSAEAIALLRAALRIETESIAEPIHVRKALDWLRAEQHAETLNALSASTHQRAATQKLLGIAARLSPGSRLAGQASALLLTLARPLPWDVEAHLPAWTALTGDASEALGHLRSLLASAGQPKTPAADQAIVLGLLHFHSVDPAQERR